MNLQSSLWSECYIVIIFNDDDGDNYAVFFSLTLLFPWLCNVELFGQTNCQVSIHASIHVHACIHVCFVWTSGMHTCLHGIHTDCQVESDCQVMWIFHLTYVLSTFRTIASVKFYWTCCYQWCHTVPPQCSTCICWKYPGMPSHSLILGGRDDFEELIIVVFICDHFKLLCQDEICKIMSCNYMSSF